MLHERLNDAKMARDDNKNQDNDNNETDYNNDHGNDTKIKFYIPY